MNENGSVEQCTLMQNQQWRISSQLNLLLLFVCVWAQGIYEGVHVVMPNHGLVHSDPHVTQKLESHVELFSMWNADLEEAPNWILSYSVLTLIVVIREKYYLDHSI